MTLTSDASGGTGPYTYLWYTAASCANTPLIGESGPTLSVIPTTTTTYSYKVTDSTTATACSVGDTVTDSNPPSAGPITPANPSIVQGQSVTLTSHAAGGTNPFTYQWYTSSDCITSPVTGATGSTYSASPSVPTTYYYQAIDSATTPETVCSGGDAVTVTPVTAPLAAGAITPSSPSIDNGQSVTLTSDATGGTGPYTYQWYTGAACTTVVTGALGSTYSPSPVSTTTYSYQVTDSAGTPAIACSAGDTVTVNSALTREPSLLPAR